MFLSHATATQRERKIACTENRACVSFNVSLAEAEGLITDTVSKVGGSPDPLGVGASVWGSRGVLNALGYWYNRHRTHPRGQTSQALGQSVPPQPYLISSAIFELMGSGQVRKRHREREYVPFRFFFSSLFTVRLMLYSALIKEEKDLKPFCISGVLY